MKNSYDVIVVGAGPAGSIASKYAADKGISVLLLEKDASPGFPVRCGEAVNRKRIEEFLTIKPEWIAAVIKKFSLNSPDGTEVILHFSEEGFILNRKLFDYELASSAVDSGVDLVNHAYVYDLITEQGLVTGVKADISGIRSEIKSKVVIAADGVESRVGRFAGLRTYTDFRDMECSVQVTAGELNDISDDTCYFYFGKDYAPGGYLWVFPKGNNKANIGLGITGAEGKHKSAEKYLDGFLNKKYPGIKVISKIAGGVPCTTTLDKITAPGIMLAGDAARQVNPLTGGGIVSGMTAGSIAGRIAAESVLNNKPGHILSYEKEWHDRLGKKHEIYNRLKKGVYNFSDSRFNKIAYSFLKVPPPKRTLNKLFTTALVNDPGLLVDVAKVFMV